MALRLKSNAHASRETVERPTMSDADGPHPVEKHESRRTEHDAVQTGGGPEQVEAPGGASYAGSLLGDPRLDGRGNGPVKIAMMQRAQKMYGNRTVQRMLHTLASSAKQSPAHHGGRTGNIKIQRQHVQMVTGRYVGDLPGATANIREDVLEVLNRLHALWSITTPDYGTEHGLVASRPARSQIQPSDIPLTIAAIRRNEEPTLNPATAQAVLGITISGNVGRGQTNNKADIYLLQDALHINWNITNEAYDVERPAINAGPDPVREADIPRTIAAITNVKVAHVAGTTRRGGLLAGTRVVTPGDQQRVEAALVPGIRRDASTGALESFVDTVAGRTYRQDIEQALDQVRREEFARSQQRLGRTRLPMTRFEGIGDEAKRQTDVIFGRYASGPPFQAGVNLIDRSTQRPDVSELVRYLISDDRALVPVRQAHKAINSRPEEQAIVEAVIREYPYISAQHERELEVIDQAWPALASGGVVEIQPFEAATPEDTRSMLWESFQTMIHEYLHTITHENFSRVAHSLGDDKASILVEGTTSLFTDDVWRAIHPAIISTNDALRANVEGTAAAYDASVIPPIDNLHYRQITQAREIQTAVGPENMRAAYFLGRTDLIGLPTSLPATAAGATPGQTYRVPPTGVRTVADVAHHTGTTAEAIAAANGLSPNDRVRRGQTLIVPGAAAAVRRGQ